MKTSVSLELRQMVRIIIFKSYLTHEIRMPIGGNSTGDDHEMVSLRHLPNDSFVHAMSAQTYRVLEVDTLSSQPGALLCTWQN